MRGRMLALSATLALTTASLADVAAAEPITNFNPFTKAEPVTNAGKKHAAAIAVTKLPGGGRGGWGGPEWYTKGWGGWGWGYGAGQGLFAGALVNGGLTAPYYDFTFGYPTARRPYGYPYTAFPYGVGYPYYNISYGYYRPPSHH